MSYETAVPSTLDRYEKGAQDTKDIPIIQEMTKRITALLSELEHGCSRLHATAEKVSGPVPENDSATSQPIGGDGCLIDELSRVISKLSAVNSSINSAANRLQKALG